MDKVEFFMKSKITLHTLQEYKNTSEPIAVLTAYDATFAQYLDASGIDIILVGDSLGMVIQGHESTVPVTLEQICYHIECVKRGCQSALLLADMPYMSYATPEQSVQSARLLMQAGANMVKLEGGHWLSSTVTALSERGIPVCAHLGLTPQSVDALGGYKIQGRDETSAQNILDDALALENAGAKLLVLECIPTTLAQTITERLTIPTIGIGAGIHCDGQVLVLHDMLGLNTQLPRFVKNYMLNHQGNIQQAIMHYVKDVKTGTFPEKQHSFE